METIKAHPYLTIGGVLLAGVALWVLSSSGGNGTTTTGVDPSAIAAATALQQTQMQVQAAGQQQQTALQAQAENDASQQALAQIQGKYSFDIANLGAGVQLANINAQEQTASLESSLSAQTQQKAIDAATQQSAIQANESVANTSTLANALVQQSTNQMNTVLGVVQTQTQGAIQMKQQSCGFFGAIFGC